ncbi:unnamed protein product [Alopecurus aequalis]
MAGSGKGCEECREWQEHYYWEHIDVNKIRFFKLMTGDFQQKIRIPDKFASNFIRQMQTAEGLELKAPSGKTWHVGVTKVANEVFLESGWGDFAKAHELQENDLLIFTCTGKSSFEVVIFDASGCEKLSPLFAGRMRKHFDHMGDQQVEQYSVDDDSDSDDDDDTSVPPQLIGSPHNASTSKKYSARTKPRKELPESPNSGSCDLKLEATEEEQSDHDMHPYYYYSRATGQLIDKEIREIIRLAKTRQGNPAFMIVLQRSHVQPKNNFLVIHFEFAADHLQKKPPGVLLFRPSREKKWLVRYYHSSEKRGFSGQEWVRFVSDNAPREGDVCIFELIKGARKKTVTMAVHVARRRKKDGRFVTVA